MYSLRNDYIALHQYHTRLLREYGDYTNIRDAALLNKFKMIHDKLEQLRHMLSMEKQELERERLQTRSLYSLPNKEIIYQPPYHYPREIYSPPVPHSYINTSPAIDWTNYIVTPNYEYEAYINDLPPTNIYESLYSKNMNEIRGDPRIVGLYRGHLEDVERMCNAELVNMESSMMNLRKIRRDWNSNEIYGTVEPVKRKSKRVRHKKVYFYRDY